jgi:hypothetical protein
VWTDGVSMHRLVTVHGEGEQRSSVRKDSCLLIPRREMRRLDTWLIDAHLVIVRSKGEQGQECAHLVMVHSKGEQGQECAQIGDGLSCCCWR